MAWTITDTVSSTNVEVSPYAGRIRRTVVKPTGVFDVLRGSTRMVQHGPTRKATIELPPFRILGDASLSVLTTILGSGHRISILDDTGTTTYVHLNGEYTIETEDLPDRDTAPVHTVFAKFVEVA